MKFRNSAESDFWQRAYLTAISAIGSGLIVVPHGSARVTSPTPSEGRSASPREIADAALQDWRARLDEEKMR